MSNREYVSSHMVTEPFFLFIFIFIRLYLLTQGAEAATLNVEPHCIAGVYILYILFNIDNILITRYKTIDHYTILFAHTILHTYRTRARQKITNLMIRSTSNIFKIASSQVSSLQGK